MTMRRTQLTHGLDGFHLIVEDVAIWSVAAQKIYEGLIALLGHPCCQWRDQKSTKRTIWGWVLDHLPLSDAAEERIAMVQFRILNNRWSHATFRHTNRQVWVPITTEQARSLDPQWADDQLREEEEHG